MQDYLWDGIKRDRLVWVADMHPEVMTIKSVFGSNEVVPKSLDLIQNITDLPNWMNGLSSYSIWWILIQHEWYKTYGDLAYLRKHQDYIFGLLDVLKGKMDEKGIKKDQIGLEVVLGRDLAGIRTNFCNSLIYCCLWKSEN